MYGTCARMEHLPVTRMTRKHIRTLGATIAVAIVVLENCDLNSEEMTI
jgi:hypothetical protein